MKIKRKTLASMWGLINKILGEKTSVKFHYLMLKNKKLLEPEIESLQKTNEPPQGKTEFEEKRVKLCKEYAEKDEAGKPKLEDDQFGNKNFVVPDEAKPEFEEKLAVLKEEYKSAFDEFEKQQKDFLDLLEEEVEIELARIPLSIMPEDIVGTDVELLFDLIDEDC